MPTSSPLTPQPFVRSASLPMIVAAMQAPDYIALKLKQIEETSKTAHQIMFVLLVLSAFIGMTILNLADGDFFSVGTLIVLPVIQKPLTARAFYLVAPFVALAMYSYLLITTHALLHSLRYLPSRGSDGAPIGAHLPASLLVQALAHVLIEPHSAIHTAKPFSARPTFVAIKLGLCATVLWLPVPLVAALGLWRVARVPAPHLRAPLFGLFIFTCLLTAVSMRAVYVRGWPRRVALLDRAVTVLVGLFGVAAILWLALGRAGYLAPLSMRRHDLVAADLRGLNLSGADLSGANLRSADLTGTNLQQAVLTNATLDQATLRSANLSNANCTGTSFAGADLTRSAVTGGTFENATFDGANLTELSNAGDSTFIGASLRKVRILAADVPTVIGRADFTGCDFSGAQLSSVDLRAARFVQASFDNATLVDVQLDEANLSYSHLTNAHLSGVSLTNANLTGANLAIAWIDRSSDLSRAILANVRAERAVMQYVRLAGADLHGGDFEGARLSGANLESAKLQAANLRSADLSGAQTNLAHANLIGANFAGANLTDLECLSDAIVPAQWLQTLAGMNPMPTGLPSIRQKWRVDQTTRNGGVVCVLKPQ